MCSVHIVYSNPQGEQAPRHLGPNGPLLCNPPIKVFLAINNQTRAHRLLGPTVHSTHEQWVFYPVTCPVDCFILVISSLNLVISSPNVLYYLYMHILCVFRSTQGSFWYLHIHLISCILYLECNFRSKSLSYLKTHKKCRHDRTIYNCDQFDYICNTMAYFTKHCPIKI